MRYIVPKFIEHEPKVVGPFTLKQFIFIGVAGGICFLLYFIIGKENFFLYLILCSVLGGIGFALAFLKVEGRPLPLFLSSFFKFSLSPKLYIWKKKKGLPPKVIPKKETKTESETIKKITPTPKILGESRLKKLSTEIETKIR